jgi:hypothetical protein
MARVRQKPGVSNDAPRETGDKLVDASNKLKRAIGDNIKLVGEWRVDQGEERVLIRTSKVNEAQLKAALLQAGAKAQSTGVREILRFDNVEITLDSYARATPA